MAEARTTRRRATTHPPAATGGQPVGAAKPVARAVRGPNAQRHALSREALLRTARAIFARDGYAQARTADLVAGTGLTRGAIYYHFPDKLALFDAVVEQVAEDITARVDAAAGGAPTALDGLRRGCREWFATMADPELRRLYLVDGPAALGSTRWRAIDNTHGGGSLRAGILAAAAEQGAGDLPVDALVALLTGALNETALWLADAPDPAGARRDLDAGLDLLLDRLFPTP